MLGQLQMTLDGRLTDKVETAIHRLQAFEPEEGYYVAFSGGKDSQCIYHLCKLGGVKFDAHYAITSVDPPELVRFIKNNYPDVKMDAQHYSDGKPEHYYPDGRPKPITMWSLIADHTLPPTRKVRYCCAKLKEPGGDGRIVVTGVRWAESINRKNTHGVVGFRGKPKGTAKIAEEIGADYKLNKHGDVIMNDDNDENRRMVEQCYRTRKTMVNPIVDWTDEDVWEFLNGLGVEHCSLYDEGFTRLGCIGCPLSGSKNMLSDFERWPKYKENYIRAFQRMIENHPGQIKILDPNADTKFKLSDDASENIGGGVSPKLGQREPLMESPTTMAQKFPGGQSLLQDQHRGTQLVSQGMEQVKSLDSTSITSTDNFAGGGTNSQKQCSGDGSRWRFAEYVYDHWVEMGAI